MGLIRSILRRRSKKKTSSPAASSSSSPSTPRSPTPMSSSAEMERVFAKFDTNGDGKISSFELAAIFESLGHPATDDELARMMAEADTDGDGFISLDEFVRLNDPACADPAAALEDLRHAFSVFDLDRNGSISAEELARVLRGIGETASVAQCKRMIDGVDRDGDGMISFEEFKIMMTQGSGAGLGLASAVTSAKI